MPQLMRQIVSLFFFFYAPPGSKAERMLIESEGRKTEMVIQKKERAEREGEPGISSETAFDGDVRSSEL